MNFNTYSDRQDKHLANFIVGYYFVQALNLLVKLVLGNFSWWTLASRGILIVLLLFALKPMISRKGIALLAVELLFAALFGYTFAFQFASLNDFGTIALNIFTVFIPMAIAIASIKDKSILLQRMYVASWPVQLILLYVLLARRGSSYSMIGGYTLVFQELIVMDHYSKKHKLYDLLMCAVDSIVIFLFGSRGPLLCIMTMVVIKVLLSPTLSRRKRIILISLSILLLGGVFVFYTDIINGLIILTNRLGYSSRTLYLLLDSRITSDSGRDSIQRRYMEVVRNGPVLGHGIAGGWLSSETYPHNIFLEMLVSFGPIFGVLVCVAISLVYFLAIIDKDQYRRRVSHILFAYSISLFLSDTFLKSPMFFMLMAIGLQSIPIKISSGEQIPEHRLS